MHKIFLRFLFIIIIVLIALLVFLSTKGVKTNNFNSLIIQKVNEINQKSIKVFDLNVLPQRS